MFTIDSLSNAKPKKQKRFKESTIIEIRSNRDSLSNELQSIIDNEYKSISNTIKRDYLMPITLDINLSLGNQYRNSNKECNELNLTTKPKPKQQEQHSSHEQQQQVNFWNEYYGSSKSLKLNSIIKQLKELVLLNEKVSRIVFSFLFKHTDYYIDHQQKTLLKQELNNNINNDDNKSHELGDGSIDDIFSMNDYNLCIPLHLFLYIIDRINLKYILSSLFVSGKIQSKYNIEVLELIDSMILSLKSIENPPESALQSLFHIFYKYFTSQSSSPDSVSQFSLHLNRLLEFSKNITDQTLRFRIVLVFLKLLLKGIKSMERQQYINSLEVFSRIFQEWNGVDLIYEDVKSLQSILSNEKFERPTIGILNFKLYSYLNNNKSKNDNNNSSSSSICKYKVKSLNIEYINNNILYDNEFFKMDIKDYQDWIPTINFKQQNHLNFINHVHLLAPLKPTLFLSNRNINDGESYIDFIYDVIVIDHEYYLLSVFIWIPYHLSTVILDQQLSLVQIERFQYLLNIWFKYLDKLLDNSSLTSKFDYEIIWIIYFYLYFLHSKKNIKIEFLDKLGIVCLQSYSKISKNELKSFVSMLHRVTIVDDILKLDNPYQHLQLLYNNNFNSIQLSITKCLNQISTNTNQDDYSETIIDDTILSRQNEIIEELQMFSLLDSSRILEIILKNSIKNKGQQKFLSSLLIEHLLTFLSHAKIDRDSLIFNQLYQLITTDENYQIVTDQSRANCLQFIDSILLEIRLPFMINRYIDSLLNEIVLPILSSKEISPSKIAFILDLLELILSKYLIDSNQYKLISTTDDQDELKSINFDVNCTADLFISITKVYKAVLKLYSSIWISPLQIQQTYQIIKSFIFILYHSKINNNSNMNKVESLEDTDKIDWIFKLRIDYYKLIHFNDNTDNILQLVYQPINIVRSKNFTKDMTILHNIIDISCISKQHTLDIIKFIGICLNYSKTTSNTDRSFESKYKYLKSLFSSDYFESLLLLVLSIQLPFSSVGYFDILFDDFIPQLMQLNWFRNANSFEILYQCVRNHFLIFSKYHTTPTEFSLSFIKSSANQLKKLFLFDKQQNQQQIIDQALNYCNGLYYLIKTISLLLSYIDIQVFYILLLTVVDKLTIITKFEGDTEVFNEKFKHKVLKMKVILEKTLKVLGEIITINESENVKYHSIQEKIQTILLNLK